MHSMFCRQLLGFPSKWRPAFDFVRYRTAAGRSAGWGFSPWSWNFPTAEEQDLVQSIAASFRILRPRLRYGRSCSNQDCSWSMQETQKG
jgi:hypothetical protein